MISYQVIEVARNCNCIYSCVAVTVTTVSWTQFIHNHPQWEGTQIPGMELGQRQRQRERQR